MSTKTKLWMGVIGLGALTIYLVAKLVGVVADNRSLANESNSHRQQRDNAIQQANVDRQQKDAAVQKSVELENKVAQLKSELDQQKPHKA